MATQTSRAVASAIKSASARGAGRTFRWGGLQGAVVAAVAGMAAGSALMRRQEMEEARELADARVARADKAVDDLRDALVQSAADVVVRVAGVRGAEARERAVVEWVGEVAGREKGKVEGKTSFV